MQTISGEEFQKRIYSENATEISNLVVEINTPLNIDLQNVNLFITFSNVKFLGKKIYFYKYKKEYLHRLRFEKCIFECNILFESDFEDLTFISNTFNCDRFHIGNSTIGVVDFSNDESNTHNNTPNIFKKGSFKIYDCNFSSIFWLKNVQFMKGTSFDISSVNFNNGFYFDSISLDRIMFYNCTFSNEFRYNSLYNISEFTECSFLGLAKFSAFSYLNTSFLRFENCHFFKLADFNNYWLHKLRIEETTFSDNVSFQQTYFDIVCFVRTIFEKKVWFDDIRIKKIDDCDRITIRTIKQELQKAENKIDYNRFRVYEFNAYRKDIKKKLIEFKEDKNHFYHRKRDPIQLRRDLFILNISDIVSEYGTDWKRAIKFTLLSGFILYFLFFICENYDHKIDFLNWDNFTQFTSGLFRFFLVTDFFNPLENDRIYLTNPLSWIVFIFGKIIIAFGIYEMIQSFRKFKA